MSSAPPRCELPAVVQAVLWFTRPTALLEACHRRYGDVFSMRLPDLGDVVMLCDPESIREVFTGDPDALHAGEGNAPLGPALGASSMLLLDGDEHVRHRRLIMPALHGERMSALATTMCETAAATIDGWPRSTPFSLRTSMQALTLEVMLRTVFGVDDPAEIEALRRHLRQLLDLAAGPWAPVFVVPWLQRDLGAWSPWSRFLRERDASDALIYRLIERRRAAPDPRRSDVLSMLLSASDEHGAPLANHELRDELITLLIAGHETTATALTWAFERVLSNARVHRRLLTELDEVCGGGPLHGSAIAQLAYLDATIKEVHRMRPVIPLVVRKVKKPLLVGRYRMPEGIRVTPCIYLAQRRRETWEDPDVFSPERFLGKKIDPYAWLPFGGGVRRCVGMAFALYEMKIVLATALRRLDMRLAEPAPVRLVRRSITYAPVSGTVVAASPRATARDSVAAPAQVAVSSHTQETRAGE